MRPNEEQCETQSDQGQAPDPSQSKRGALADLGLIGLLVGVCYVLVWPVGEYAIVDDWASDPQPHGHQSNTTHNGKGSDLVFVQSLRVATVRPAFGRGGTDGPLTHVEFDGLLLLEEVHQRHRIDLDGDLQTRLVQIHLLLQIDHGGCGVGGLQVTGRLLQVQLQLLNLVREI